MMKFAVRELRMLAFVLVLLVRTAGAQLVTATTAECATSTDGSVVGVLNPLNPPQVSTAFTGTLGIGTYYIEIAYYDASAHVTLASPEVQQQLTSTGQLQISPPVNGMPASAAGMNVYISASSGTETLQGTTTGSATFIQSVPLATGAALPTSNTTVCSVIANDSGWPTGTGYKVSLTTPAGNTYPGYPQQWQLLGPGSTINLSQGLPLYNGTVTYPVPILSRPYGQGTQSIYGPLSLTGFNLTNVNRLGIGTQVPGWGVDAEGTGINGMINAVNGYLVNGVAPAAGTCLGTTDGIAFDTAITCVSGLPTTFYQTVASNGVAQTQRPTLNFTPTFTTTDSSSPAETTIGLASTGAAGTYTNPSSITVNTSGQITAATSGGASSFILGSSTGLILEGGSTGTCSSTATVTFPHAFSTTPISCQATGVGGSVNINGNCSTTGMTINCSGVSNVYWLALGAN